MTNAHEALIAVGQMARMNAALIDPCIENNSEIEHAIKVGEEAQKRYNIIGAPAFIINGHVHVGEFRRQDLQKLLDSLAKKK